MRRIVFAFGYTLLALAVALIGGYLVVSFMVTTTPEVEVPSVTGLTLSDALDKLNQNKLDLEVRDFVFSSAVGENRVVRQRPREGEVVKQGRSVGVVLSRGPERNAVPDVVGQNTEDAAIALSQASLVPESAERIPWGAPGVVVAQGAAPGFRLAKGEKIPLLVSEGPAPVVLRMPRLEGLSREEAEQAVKAMGLRIERVEEDSFGIFSLAGRVMGQEPPAGSPVSSGSAVSLTVGGGGGGGG